jgi:hypothetical protein
VVGVCGPPVPGRGDTLTWEGDVSVNWFEGVVGSNTNWHNSAGQQVLPTTGDDLVFNKNGAYSGDLTLGGVTITLNSITVGDPTNRTPGGMSDFGVDLRTLATNGKIRLGAGGLHVYFPDGVVNYEATGNTRNYRFNTDFEFTANSAVQGHLSPTLQWKNRQIFLGGELSGGSLANPITLELSTTNGGDGETKAIFVEKAMPNLYGTLRINGANSFSGSTAIWGAPSTTVQLSTGGTTNAYAWKKAGSITTPNNISLSTSRQVLLFNAGTAPVWTFTGNITDGKSTLPFDLLGTANSVYDFRGAEQSFANYVTIRTGVTAVISAADANGVAWPNVAFIRVNSSQLSAGTSGLLLRGNFRLTKNVEVYEYGHGTSPLYIPARIGEVNDGATPFDAVFTGQLTCLEQHQKALRLTADAGGSATFEGPIRIAAGYGFDKIGAGTVSINNRVSQDSGTAKIGAVEVQQGTLLVNSPAANGNSFYTTGILVKDGATLGGAGAIVGDVTLQGTVAATLAPGASIGTLTVNGNVDFESHGRLLVELGPTAADRLDVTGTLDLSALDDQLLVQSVGSPGLYAYVIASYGTLVGQFDSLSLPAGYRIDYQHGGLNQIALVAPEPAAVVLLAIGGLAIVGWTRRRKWNDQAIRAWSGAGFPSPPRHSRRSGSPSGAQFRYGILPPGRHR